jgi:hypothetical protein
MPEPHWAGREQPAGGSGGAAPTTPDLAAVLAEGGDPGGNPITGALVQEVSVPVGTYDFFNSHLDNVDGAPLMRFEVNRTSATNGNATLDIEAQGDGDARISLSDWNLDGGLSLSTSLGSYFTPRSTQTTADPVAQFGITGAAVKLMVGGYIVIQAHAAPADGDLAAGDMAIWFDQTNGAGKLKIKAKTANGTVAVGELALT